MFEFPVIVTLEMRGFKGCISNLIIYEKLKLCTEYAA